MASPPADQPSAAQLAGEERFNDAYEKALLRKRLFKEYLQRHQVVDRFNRALEALYDCGTLPEDPMAFVTEQLMTAPRRPQQQRPTSAKFKR